MFKNKFLLPTTVTFLLILISLAIFSPNCALAAGITIPAGTGLPDPADTTGLGPVVQVTVNIMKWVLSIFIILAVIAFVYTGIKFLMTAGDQYAATAARQQLQYSIIAVAVVAAGLVFINTIDIFLR